MKRIAPTLATLCFTAFISQDLVGQVQVDVGSKVIVKAEDFEPLGVNYLGDAGGQRHSAGNLIWNPGFEPFTMRNLYRVIDSGQENGKYWVQLDGPGTSNHIRFASGVYSGASMRAYRFVDGRGQPLPYKDASWTDGGKVLDGTDAENVRPLFKTTVVAKGEPGFPKGGWIADVPFDDYNGWMELDKEGQAELKKTWRVYYEGGQELRMDDLVIFEQTQFWPELEDFHPRMNNGVHIYWDVPTGSVRQVPIPEDAPVEMKGGKGVLRVTPDDGVVELWNKQWGATGREDAFYYGTMEEDGDYVYELWAKVDGRGKATLTLGFGDNRSDAIERGYFGQPLSDSFVIDSEWKKVRFTFKGLPTPVDGGIAGACVRVESNQPVMIDNVKLQRVYSEEDHDKDFVIYKPLFDEMVENQPPTGRKGAARLWEGLTEGTMEGLTDLYPDNKMGFQGGKVALNAHHLTTFPKALTILEATGDSPETRMVPWFILQIMHTEEEHRHLVEFLAAPYDPDKDSPESKPFAYKRYLQRGHGEPWTETFREIMIEFGNENWHNRAHVGWIGVGRSGHIYGAGEEYGVWYKYMTREMMKSPYWDEKKLTIMLGAGYVSRVNGQGIPGGYGYDSTMKADGTVDYHSHATYIGPRWETGEKSQTSIDDEGVQRTLLSYRPVKEGEWASHEKAHNALWKLGYKAKMTAYEGGPSGFGYRAKTKEEEQAGEYYGKSVAMATAMLDAWADAWEKGWTHQCYLSFRQGKWWSSHTSFSMGFRPSPGFLAQTMLNHTMANHDLLEVEVKGSVMLNTSDAVRERDRDKFPYQIKSVVAHAAGNRDRIAVTISNLSLAEDQEVQISLPLSSVKTVTLHRMTGGPRDTNLEEENVTLETVELDAADFRRGSFTYTAEAGKSAVLVFSNDAGNLELSSGDAVEPE